MDRILTAFPLVAVGAIGYLLRAGGPEDAPIGLLLDLGVLVAVSGVLAVALAAASRGRADETENFARRLDDEVARARRFDRTFAIVRLPVSPSDAARRVSEEAPIRRLDVAHAEGSDVYLLLPEADEARARAVLRRLQATLPQVDHSAVSTAIFPYDAFTSAALMDAVRADRRLPTPFGAAGKLD